MLVAYVISGQVEEIEHLIEKGIDLRENLTLLQTAVEEGHFEVVKLLLKNKV
jgi:hypothetical protein